MKKIESLNLNFSNAQQLTRQQMKKVMGGTPLTTISECAVYCGTEKKTRDCGRGVSCVTNGSTITCGGSDCKDMCTGKPCGPA